VLHLISAVTLSVFAATFGVDTELTEEHDKRLSRVAIYADFFALNGLFWLQVQPRFRALSFIIVFYLFVNTYVADEHTEFTAFLTSLECISCWISFLWYAQPFSSTGPLISIIQYVLLDILSFTVMGIFIVIGFGFAFLVLFSNGFIEDDGENFNSPHRSFESLFYAVLGEFDPDVFRSSPYGFLSIWRISLFNVFLFLGPVVLLSLLISILGDTFDRVKLTQEAELFKCRARMIRTCADWSMWTSRILLFFKPAVSAVERKLKISEKCIVGSLFMLLFLSLVLSLAGWILGWMTSFIGLVQIIVLVPLLAALFHYKFWFKKDGCVYLHHLVPVDQLGKDKDTTWQGKLLALERMIQTAIEKHEHNTVAERRDQQTELCEMKRQIITRMEAHVAVLSSQICEIQEKLELAFAERRPDQIPTEKFSKSYKH